MSWGLNLVCPNKEIQNEKMQQKIQNAKKSVFASPLLTAQSHTLHCNHFVFCSLVCPNRGSHFALTSDMTLCPYWDSEDEEEDELDKTKILFSFDSCLQCLTLYLMILVFPLKIFSSCEIVRTWVGGRRKEECTRAFLSRNLFSNQIFLRGFFFQPLPRGAKTQNFPGSNFLRAKTFWAKCAKPFLTISLKSALLPLTTFPKNA